jgi:hypothetical protein
MSYLSLMIGRKFNTHFQYNSNGMVFVHDLPVCVARSIVVWKLQVRYVEPLMFWQPPAIANYEKEVEASVESAIVCAKRRL